MPTVATDYRPDFHIPEEIRRDDGVTLSCPVYDSTDTVVQATSGTFTLLDQGGRTVASGAVTPSATLTATYAIASSAIEDEAYGFRYRVRWDLVLAGESHVFINTAGIVREAFAVPVRDTDLTARHSELLTLIQGTGDTDLTRWITEAYRQCVRWMVRQGNRPAAVLDGSQLKELVTLWALEVVMRDLSTGLQDSHFGELADHYHEARKDLQSTITFAYDADLDGAEDEDVRRGRSVTFLSDHGWYRHYTGERR